MAGLLAAWTGGESAELFVRRFAEPLLAGGRVACTAPLGWKRVKGWTFPAESRRLAADLHHALRARAAHVDAVPPADPDASTLLLLGAVHDLLTTAHPDTSNALDMGARVLRGHAAAALALGWPDTLPVALSRHAVLEAAFDAVREDVTVSWWTGSQRFAGTLPPARLLMMPRVRRVRRDTRRVSILEDAMKDGSLRLRSARRGLLGALFVASPVSALLLSMEDRNPLPLDLRQAMGGPPLLGPLRFLGHAPLRTLLCDAALAAGFTGPVATWSQAVNALVSASGPPPWAVARALRFTLVLHERRLLELLFQRGAAGAGTGTPRDRKVVAPVLPPEALAHPAARLVWGLWLAARRVSPALGMVPTRELEPLARELESAVSTPTVQEAAQSLQGAIRARLGEELP